MKKPSAEGILGLCPCFVFWALNGAFDFAADDNLAGQVVLLVAYVSILMVLLVGVCCLSGGSHVVAGRWVPGWTSPHS